MILDKLPNEILEYILGFDPEPFNAGAKLVKAYPELWSRINFDRLNEKYPYSPSRIFESLLIQDYNFQMRYLLQGRLPGQMIFPFAIMYIAKYDKQGYNIGLSEYFFSQPHPFEHLARMISEPYDILTVDHQLSTQNKLYINLQLI